MGKQKRPRIGAQPPGQTPRVHANPDQFEGSRPVWRLSLMQLDDGARWSWRGISLEDLLTVRRRLGDMEKCLVGNLHETGSHLVPSHHLGRDAQNELLRIGHDDVDGLYSLRINGRQRAWAIRDRNVFSLLWWDPEHEVCPSTRINN